MMIAVGNFVQHLSLIHISKTLQIALGSYDRKELRVEKNYLQEQSPALELSLIHIWVV